MANNWKLKSEEQYDKDRKDISTWEVLEVKNYFILRAEDRYTQSESDLIQSLDMLQEELDFLKELSRNMKPMSLLSNSGQIEKRNIFDRINKLTAHLKQWIK